MGNLIRTYGSQWQEEVPSLLRSDEWKKGGESNLQERVIQSGLDAITGTDASSIVTLFKAMAVYAEGTVTHVLSYTINA